MADQETTDEKIDRYITHFNEELISIRGLRTQRAPLFQPILYTALIDTLSKSVCKQFNWQGNRQRFAGVVEKFSDWAEKDRISLPHLVQALTIGRIASTAIICDYAFSEIKKWQDPWGPIPINKDPEISQIKELLSEVDPTTIFRRYGWEQITHNYLLYSYRNSLVHEFRKSGYGMESMVDDYPAYHDLHTVEHLNRPSKVTFELVYPRPFLFHLCKTIIGNLGNYLKANKINPYNGHRFGSFWNDDLNDDED